MKKIYLVPRNRVVQLDLTDGLLLGASNETKSSTMGYEDLVKGQVIENGNSWSKSSVIDDKW